MAVRALIVGDATYRVAGQTVDSGGSLWEGRLTNAPTLEELGKVPMEGNQLRQVSLAIANLEDDGTPWIDVTTESLWGNAVILYFDGESGTRTWNGVIKSWSQDGAGTLSLSVAEEAQALFSRLIPDEVVRLSTYPDAAREATSKTVPTVFGGTVADPIRVPGVLVDRVNFRYLFCVGELRQIVTVYKDREVVAAGFTTYTGTAGQANYPGFAYIEFAADPRDSAGRWPEIHADVVGLKLAAYTEAECRNPARVLYYFLLTAATGVNGWGLGISAGDIDATTFATAITDCDTAAFKLDGALFWQKPAKFWVDEILRGMRGELSRDASGKITLAIDKAKASVATFTESNMRLTQFGRGISTDRVNKVIVDYRYDSTDGTLLASQTREDAPSQGEIGTQEKRITGYLLRDHTTAGKIADYLLNSETYGEQRIAFETADDCSTLVVGNRITITRSDLGLSGAAFQIARMVPGDFVTLIEARGYSDSIFAVSGGSSTTDPATDPTIPGPEAMVPPATPSGISLASGTVRQTDGTILAYVDGSYTAGARTLYMDIELGEGAAPGTWYNVRATNAGSFHIDGLKVGQLYTFRFTPRNTGGAGTAQTSAITTSTDTTTPGKPGTPVASVTFKSVRVLCYQNAVKSPDLAGFKILRHTANDPASATEAGFQPCGGNEDGAAFFDLHADYGQTYYYWTKAVDRSGNISVISDLATGCPLNTAQVASADITANQIIGKDFRTACNVGNGVVSGIKFDSAAVEGWNGGTKNFCLSATDGTLYAQNATITGTMCASVGVVGGFTIAANCLNAGSGAAAVGMQSLTGAGCIAFYAGCDTPGSAPFKVTNQGAVTATSGAIGGWTLGANALSAGSGTCAAGLQSLTAAGCVSIYAGCATPGSAPFRVTNQGALVATSATVAGAVCATSGYFCSCIYSAAGVIGGFSIGACTLTAGAAASYVGLSCNVACPAVWAGCDTGGSAPFRVTHAGALTATSATIVGAVCATSGCFIGTVCANAGYFCSCIYAGAGCIAGWSLTTCKICAGNVGLDSCTTAGTVAFYAGCSTPASAPFRVTNQGCLTATSADITGAICASSGCVAGWSITTCKVCSAASGLDSCATAGTIAIWAGCSTPASAPFRVTNQGCLVATSACITGTICATTGVIGGWTIGATCLCAGAAGTTVGLDTGGTCPAIWAGCATGGSAPFRVTNTGALTATSATITGTVCASAGCIAGWSLATCQICSATSGLDSCATAGAVALWLGCSTPGSAPFRVTNQGCVVATCGTVGGWTLGAASLTGGNVGLCSAGWACFGTGNDFARIDASDATYRLWIGNATAPSAPFSVTKAGAIKATSGTIGGWAIGTDCICSAGIIINCAGSIYSTNFASGLAGWKISCTGDAEFANASIRGELRSAVFVYDEVHAVGGQLLVAGASTFLTCATTPGALGCCFAACFKDPPAGHAQLFQVGEILRAKTFNGTSVYDIWSRVQTATNCITYYHYCLALCSGSTGAVLPEGTAIVSYGQATTCCGAIMANGQGACSPYLDVFITGTTPWSGLTPKVRLGTLNGLAMFSACPNCEYGLWTCAGYIVGGVVQSNNWGAGAGSCFDLTNGCFALGGSSAPTLSWNGAALCVVGCVDTVCDFYHNTVRFITTRATSNVFVGTNAGATSVSGSANTGVGNVALSCVTTGNSNTAVGNGAGDFLTTGCLNTFVGDLAGSQCTITGISNAGIGYAALFYLTSGSYNSAVGDQAMRNLTTGCYNSAAGFKALCGLTTGCHNVGVGMYALGCCALTGTGNIGIGYLSGYFRTSGNYNTSIGFQSLTYTTTGHCNVAIGSCVAYSATTACHNVLIGTDVVKSGILTGNCNTIVGACSGLVLTSGVNNVVVGAASLTEVTTGAYNVMVGNSAGQGLVSGCYNVGIGESVFHNHASGPGNVAIGYASMYTGPLSGSYNTSVGYGSGRDVTTGNCNVFLGVYAGLTATTGCHNTIIGASSTRAGALTGNLNTVVGACSALDLAGATCNSVVGSCAASALTTGIGNAIVGALAGGALTTGCYNVVVGADALSAINYSLYNTAVGRASMQKACCCAALGFYPIGNTAVGYSSACCLLTGCYNTAVGQQSMGTSATLGSYNVAVGYFALGCCLTSGANNTAVGVNAGLQVSTGINNTAIGYGAMCAGAVTGNANVAVGNLAVNALTSGCENVGVGGSALAAVTTGQRNTAIGMNALKAISTGCDLIAIGHNALCANTSGTNNIAWGICALSANSTGYDNIAMGKNAMTCTSTCAYSNVSIGDATMASALCAISNVAIGNSALTSICCGNRNTAVGSVALQALCNKSDNTALGSAALCLSQGAYNVGIGAGAGANFTVGNCNVIVGHAAATHAVNARSGTALVGIGTYSLVNICGGTEVIGLGYLAGCAICTCNNSIAIGNAGANVSNYVWIGNASTVCNNFYGALCTSGALSAGANITTACCVCATGDICSGAVVRSPSSCAGDGAAYLPVVCNYAAQQNLCGCACNTWYTVLCFGVCNYGAGIATGNIRMGGGDTEGGYASLSFQMGFRKQFGAGLDTCCSTWALFCHGASSCIRACSSGTSPTTVFFQVCYNAADAFLRAVSSVSVAGNFISSVGKS